MKCPSCTDVNLLMSERSGIEIDYCPDCRGVWLDKGELDKIIERSAQSVKSDFNESKSFKDNSYKESFDKGKYHSDDYKYKKKKGFLGDLFDF